MNKLKLAIVKSNHYQDLWVCEKSNNYFEIFKTTLMRCSPIGFLECFDTEFIIVKESMDYPCQNIKSCINILTCLVKEAG